MEVIAIGIAIGASLTVMGIIENGSQKRKAAKKGKQGEKEVKEVLKSLGRKYKLYNDVYVPKGSDGTAQCDHIVVCDTTIIVVETKNYKGKIVYGSNNKWKQILNGKAYELYSPIKQNEGHIKYLAKYTGLDESSIKSVVVFGNEADISSIKETNVINIRELRNYVRKISSGNLSKAETSNVKKKLSSLSNSFITRHKHLKGIKLNRKYNKKKCPKCGSPLAVRDSKKGKFVGCTKYPYCDYTASIK